MNTNKTIVLLSPALIALFSTVLCANQWTGGAGDWFDGTNWIGGVPDITRLADIRDGDVQFNAPAFARELRVATNGIDGTLGELAGTDNLTIERSAGIGTASGTLTRTGAVSIIGGDFSLGDLNFAGSLAVGTASGTGTDNVAVGNGSLSVTDGNVILTSNVIASVGTAGGTGTNNTHTGNGQVDITNGNFEGSTLRVGIAGGTGSANGFADGTVSVTGGDLVFSQSITVGLSGGTSNFDGDAVGLLTVDQGNIFTDIIIVGRTSFQSNASGISDGRLIISDGNIMMEEMSVGLPISGPTYGLVEQTRGVINGFDFTLGTAGDLVLGIDGTVLGDEYSQLKANNVALDGNVEARFQNGFLPQGGDSFDLVVSDNLTGNYNLSITGINQQDYPNLRIVESSRLIRVKFLVPEPQLGLLLVACPGLFTWMRPSKRLSR